MSKPNREDKKFWIQFDQANRDFLINLATFTLIFGLTLISLLLSALAIAISIEGINGYTIILSIVFGAIMIVVAFSFSIKAKRMSKSANNINNQLQEELYKIYPEYKDKIR